MCSKDVKVCGVLGPVAPLEKKSPVVSENQARNCAAPRCAALRHAMLLHAALCCAALCRGALRCALCCEGLASKRTGGPSVRWADGFGGQLG